MRSRRSTSLLFAAAVATSAALAVSPPAQAEDAIVKLVSNQSGKCLQPASLNQGAEVIQMTCNGTRAQQWTVKFERRGVHLVNRASQFCMDAFGGATNGTPIIQWVCNDISNENWSFGLGNNLLASLVAGTRSHCIASPGPDDGLPMELRFCDGNLSQLWSRPNG
ncbi:hypothetical protein FKR81_23765 [Lentzea tibetensis]|uniref:Ricin B lectin domain-containing protein n=1 Tax=Lentzea tibetensis TaxID=2591470 RepID=A0A563EQ77_9PSEU|nr:ricin-type beta-trefoil lectin domain protein [Lentzea tibetensis]TWP49557.1 hypothetical protein FKR81_23765 [Lentzea tibetensis]